MDHLSPSPIALFGTDHEILGEVTVSELGSDTAIGLSRGRHPKGYPTLDLNEDACMAATGPGGVLLAVADGHWGFDAASAALGAVHRGAPELLQGEFSPRQVVDGCLELAIAGVGVALGAARGERARSRTTLTVACMRDGVVAAGGFGDSKAARVGSGSSRQMWKPAPFLGRDTTLADRWLVGCPIEREDWLVVASDGLLDFLGRRWETRLESLSSETPPRFVARAIEKAFDGGAGDHVAVAAARVSET